LLLPAVVRAGESLRAGGREDHSSGSKESHFPEHDGTERHHDEQKAQAEL
jgi:hypothetical protein